MSSIPGPGGSTALVGGGSAATRTVKLRERRRRKRTRRAPWSVPSRLRTCNRATRFLVGWLDGHLEEGLETRFPHAGGCQRDGGLREPQRLQKHRALRICCSQARPTTGPRGGTGVGLSSQEHMPPVCPRGRPAQGGQPVCFPLPGPWHASRSVGEAALHGMVMVKIMAPFFGYPK